MRFEDFARAHGLIIKFIISDKWVSTPTEDHPNKRNGRYKYLGDVGWVQNWATMESPDMWRSDTAVVRPFNRIVVEDKKRQEDMAKAAAKAGWILHQTYNGSHPYLEKKGFKDENGNIWDVDGKQLLVIPMRIDGQLVGCQLIGEEKKFLYGQKSKGATFVIDAKGPSIFCEGYATALSVRAAMKAIGVRYTIHVCFSASNLIYIASQLKGTVVADNDKSGVGERAAIETRKTYWISDTVGEDFNDYHIRVGLFRASQSLKRSFFANTGDTGAGTSLRSA
jgi:putative DNA primase/helicase